MSGSAGPETDWVVKLLVGAGATMTLLYAVATTPWTPVPGLPPGAGSVVQLIVVGGAAALVVSLLRVARRRRRPVVGSTGSGNARYLQPGVGVGWYWHMARERLAALRTAYAAFECDPVEVLRLPALADPSVAATARFVNAFAEAGARETDVLPAARHAWGFVWAVHHAERAWRTARIRAERMRLTRTSPGERAAVERVVGLLVAARDTDSEPERLAGYRLARTELDRLDRDGPPPVPAPARPALDAALAAVTATDRPNPDGGTPVRDDSGGDTV